MSMNELLAAHYGTGNSSAQQEAFEKDASVDLFVKTAEANGLDLNSMPDAQVRGIYGQWVENMNKLAEDEGEKEEKEEKVEKAKEEHEEKKEAMAKVAEADYLGRVMAHAYVQELTKIAGKAPADGSKFIDRLKAPLSHIGKRVSEGVSTHMEATGRRAMNAADRTSHKAGWKASEGKSKAVGAAIHAAGAAAAGGAAYGAKKVHDKVKEGSALDDLASELAVEKAASAGWDADEAAQRVFSVLTLGVSESDSVKVASAPDLESAVDVRSIELLEAAGYPVTWNE